MHSQADMLTTKLISWRAKLSAARMLLDAHRVAKNLDVADMSTAAGLDGESVQQYADRRVTTELRDWLIDPTMRALIQAPMGDVASTELFFMLEKFLGAGLMNSVDGIDFLVRALAARLEVVLGARATSVEERGDGVTVTWEQDGHDEQTDSVDVCVIALTARDMARIYPQLDDERRAIVGGLEYSALWSVALGVDPCPAETSVFVQIPTREHPDMACAVFEHNKVPGRAPKGKGLLNSYWLTDWYNKHDHLDDESVAAETAKGLSLVIPGVQEHVEFFHVTRWNPGLLVGSPGTWTALARFHAMTPPTGRIQLAGDYLGGSTTNSALASGERAAQILLNHQRIKAGCERGGSGIGDRRVLTVNQEG
jgi:oxygen-dependent protoporphyrinogen oxidase